VKSEIMTASKRKWLLWIAIRWIRGAFGKVCTRTTANN